MTDPEPEYLDDEISLANSGTGTLVFDGISDKILDQSSRESHSSVLDLLFRVLEGISPLSEKAFFLCVSESN